MATRLSILQNKHSISILLFLHNHRDPVTTREIMDFIGVRNWSTVSNVLERFREANLVTKEDVRVGSHSSKAVMWQLEPEFGTQVVQVLEQVERLMNEAFRAKQRSRQDSSPPYGRA